MTAQYKSSFLNALDVEIVRTTHDRPFEMFWDWFKQTWITLQDVKYDPNDPEHWQACLDVLSRNALPTPMEVLNFEIKVTGLSRVALAQITRGRVGWAYVVESQMPQHINHMVTVPMNIALNEKFAARSRRSFGSGSCAQAALRASSARQAPASPARRHRR